MSPRLTAGIAWTVSVLALALLPAVASAADPGAAGPPQIPVPPDRFPTVDLTATRAPSDDFAKLAPDKGTVRVIVGLQTEFTPEGALDDERVKEQRTRIDSVRERLVRSLDGTKHEVVNTFETIPSVALELDADALAALERSGLAASIEPDELSDPTLAQSTPLVESTEANSLGRDGSGQNVAVLDTGVDKAHSFLAGKVVSEACFSAGDCPGGASSSTAIGSGVPCTYAPGDCEHGTHVAGIAAGRGTSFSGVAPGANLIAINVFRRFDSGCGNRPTPVRAQLHERPDQGPRARHGAAVEPAHLVGEHEPRRRPVHRQLRHRLAQGGDRQPALVRHRHRDLVRQRRLRDRGQRAGLHLVGHHGRHRPPRPTSCRASRTRPRWSSCWRPAAASTRRCPAAASAPRAAPRWPRRTWPARGPSCGRSRTNASVSTLLGHLQATGKPITDADNGISKPRIRRADRLDPARRHRPAARRAVPAGQRRRGVQRRQPRHPRRRAEHEHDHHQRPPERGDRPARRAVLDDDRRP